jgi:hypothetical protein
MAAKPSIESALIRRFGSALLQVGFRPLSHDRLMQASQQCIDEAATSDEPDIRIVALRLHKNPLAHQSWKNEHSGLMRNVAAERSAPAQREAMLSVSLSLIERKAMFEYLRERRLPQEKRDALIRHFYPQRDVADSIRAEHLQYLRSSASYLCAGFVGRDLMFDRLFEEPLTEYEDIYQEYFYAYCNLIVADHSTLTILLEMLGSMKRRVSEWRKALLALTQSQSGTWRRPKF